MDDFEEQIRRQKQAEEDDKRYNKINRLNVLQSCFFIIALFFGVYEMVIFSYICLLAFFVTWAYVLYIQYKAYKVANKSFKLIFIGMGILMIFCLVVFTRFVILKTV